MMAELRFDVRGLPVPQGSARAFVTPDGKPVVVTVGRSPLRQWRSSISDEARRAIRRAPPLAGPVSVELWFRMPRPRSHFLPVNRSRSRPALRADAPVWVPSAPDADKLARAALDGLTAVVYGDDAQVARLAVTKRYANDGEGPGVAVRVRTLEVTR